MTCPNCKQPCLGVKTVIHRDKLFSGCAGCRSALIQGVETAARHKRDNMVRNYAQDIAQPINPREFIKANPTKAKELYTPEVYRKFS